MFISSRKFADAHKIRAEALTKDYDYDEAVRDYRVAVDAAEKTGDQALMQQLNHALQMAIHQEKQWDENRDHRIVLQLPVNIDELNPKARCTHLKKQYKKMAIKWHPDKAKGDKKRAVRKMSEIGEAKRELVKMFGCRGIR